MNSQPTGSRSSARNTSNRLRPERSKADLSPKRLSSSSATTTGKQPRPSQIKVTTLSFRNHPSVDAISLRNSQNGQPEWFEVNSRGEIVKDSPLSIQSGTEEDGSLWMELTGMPLTEHKLTAHLSRSHHAPSTKPAYIEGSSPLSSADSIDLPTKSPQSQTFTKRESLFKDRSKQKEVERIDETTTGSTQDFSRKKSSESTLSSGKKPSATKTHVTILHQPHSAPNGRSPFNIKPNKLQSKVSTPKPDTSIPEISKDSEEKKKRRRERDQTGENEVAEVKNRKRHVRSRTTHYSSDDDDDNDDDDNDDGNDVSFDQNREDGRDEHEDDSDDDGYGSRRKSTRNSRKSAEDKLEHTLSTTPGDPPSVPLRSTARDKDDSNNLTNLDIDKGVGTVDRPNKKLKTAHASTQIEDSASSTSTMAIKKLGSSTSESVPGSSKKDRVNNLKKIGGSSSNSTASSPVAGTAGSSPAGGRPGGPMGSKGGPIGKKTGSGGPTRKEPGVLDASFYSSLLKPAVEKATTASITSHILEKETVEKKAAAAEMEKLKQAELAKIRASFTANGPTLDLESQANDMQAFSTWMIKNVPAPQARIHTHGGMNNIWEAGLDIKAKTRTNYSEKLDRGEIGPGRTRDQNGLMPLPKTAEESDDLNFAFVLEMEGKWGDRMEVEKYLNDPKWFPFGKGMA